MKKFAVLLLICITLCGCSNSPEFETSSTGNLSQTGEIVTDDKNNTSEALEEVDTSDYVTLKIGMCTGQNTAKQLPLFNQKLHEKGYKINVEAVDFSLYYTFEYSSEFFGTTFGNTDTAEAIKKCEEENGILDIIFFREYGGMRGASYKLVSDGYLEPLDYKNTALYGLVPDELWETAKVKGDIYTFPAHPNTDGDYVYFNKDYVSEEAINSFDGTTEKLIEIASNIPKEDDLRRIDFSVYDYFYSDDIGICDEYDIQEGLILDYETMKAYNPFEYDPFIQELRKQNLMYDFSDGFFEKSNEDKIKAKAAITVTVAKFSEAYIEEQNLSAYCINPVGYLTNWQHAGITAKCQHKEEALQLLNEIISSGDYAEFYDMNIAGLSYSEEELEELNNSEIKVSPFAGYRIYYKDVEEFEDIEKACYDLYAELIQSSDFDGKLEQIQQKLKDMGIDDYVEKVNEILAENM